MAAKHGSFFVFLSALPLLWLLAACGVAYEPAESAPLPLVLNDARIYLPGDPAGQALLENALSEVGDSVTLRTKDGVPVTITVTDKKLSLNAPWEQPEGELAPQQFSFMTILTNKYAQYQYRGNSIYYSTLINRSKTTGTLSASISKTFSGGIEGGLDQFRIKAVVGFNLSVTQSYTVTTGPVRPGGQVSIYLFPIGTQYTGAQRYAPYGQSWYTCKPAVCSTPVGWTAKRATGIGYLLR